MKTTMRDVREGKCEEREAVALSYFGEMGRSRVVIQCPFCMSKVSAFMWSLAGCGKRCDCGAIINGWGKAFKLRAAPKETQK